LGLGLLSLYQQPLGQSAKLDTIHSIHLSQILNLLNLDPVRISNQFGFLLHLPLDYHLVPRAFCISVIKASLAGDLADFPHRAGNNS